MSFSVHPRCTKQMIRKPNPERKPPRRPLIGAQPGTLQPMPSTDKPLDPPTITNWSSHGLRVLISRANWSTSRSPVMLRPVEKSGQGNGGGFPRFGWSRVRDGWKRLATLARHRKQGPHRGRPPRERQTLAQQGFCRKHRAHCRWAAPKDRVRLAHRHQSFST